MFSLEFKLIFILFIASLEIEIIFIAGDYLIFLKKKTFIAEEWFVYMGAMEGST